jgi:uncharacterized protein with NRDE domain
MCLILVACQAHEQWPLVVLGNRDEFYNRPTAQLGPWPGKPDLLAGRDLRSGGSWMGAHRDGRWAAVTNFRESPAGRPAARSRGWLVRDYLLGPWSGRSYLDRVAAGIDEYAGCNLLVGDRQGLWHLSNREPGMRRLAAGFYGLSNGVFQADWPKICKGKEKLARLLRQENWQPSAALDMMMDTHRAPDEQLPATGVPLEWERDLSAMFIVTPDYGTRSTTLLAVNRAGHSVLVERHFTDPPQTWVESRYEW